MVTISNKNAKRKNNRKRYRRRGAKNQKISNFSVSPIPLQYRTRMKYVQTFKILADAGADYAINLFRLNSIYDPDESGVGHQPYGHDTLAPLYNNYRVYKAHATAELVVGTYAALECKPIIGFIACPALPTITNFSHLLELPKSKWKQVDANTRKVKGTYTMAKILGVTANQYKSDDLFMANMGGNPAAVAYLGVYAGMPIGSQPVNDWYITVTLIQYVEFLVPKLQVQS